MDCTLKIIAGPENGQEFLCGNETYLGRSQRCLVRLSSQNISFEHVLVTRLADDYFAENLSANGTLLNGQRLQVKTRLRLKDQIQLGDAVVRVESLPAAQSAGANRRLLLIGVVVIFVLSALAVVFFSDVSPPAQGRVPVYHIFQQYAQDSVLHEGMSPDVPAHLAEAWRLETAGDHTEAAKVWVKVRVLLDVWDQSQGHHDDLRNYRNLLDLENGKVQDLSDEDKRIAFKQWVIQMERPH